jgi:site-specific DNA-methyltransferase (adenine-specific)
MWVLIRDEYADEIGCLLRRAGLHCRKWIIWYETFGVNCSNNFNSCHRHLFYMVKDPRRFPWHPEAVNRPSDRQIKYDDPRANPSGKNWDDVWIISRVAGTHTGERLPSIPTQLPLDLLLPVIGCASDHGDLVLDPFSGSATTGEAAIRLGRHYVGIERSEHFVDLSRLRLQGVRPETD